MLYNVIIGPIETIVDWVFNFIMNTMPRFGVIGAVVGISLTINYLALPLYNIADSLQEKERKITKALEYRVKRIRKAFKGDERFMILSTYYRQNGYHPLYTLRSSLSILIEIPFFIAAYHYLSSCEALRNSSFWIFKDLGVPDGLLGFHVFGHNVSVHVLPVLMTLINFISGAVYTQDAILKEKIQQYVIATIFLVLLYRSPSGLVIYWILNNLFSLVKNIVNKTKNSEKNEKKHFETIGKKVKHKDEKYAELWGGIIFLSSGATLSILAGALLPLYVFLHDSRFFVFDPHAYLKASFFISLGFFVFWPFCIYKMFGGAVRKYIPSLFFVLFLTGCVNIVLLHTDFSILAITFDFDNVVSLSWGQTFLPFGVLALGIFVLWILYVSRKRSLLAIALSSCLLAGIAFSGVYYSRLRDTDFRRLSEGTCAYLNTYPPEIIVRMRKRSHKQMRNFVASQILPPVFREPFLNKCSAAE